GTPKIKAMQIIRELENENRGVYCGAMGMISPGRKAVFNVPIRTIRINGSQGEVGLGSGIVADSDHVSEYDECQLKSQFITNITPNSFKLIETMLWENEYIFSDEHLRRLKDSAEYFEFNCHVEELRKMLTRQEGTFQAGKKYRIRITLNENGMFDIDTVEIVPEINRKKQVVISDKQTDPEDVFLYHKTTNRLLYDREYEKYSDEFYDVIFFNNKGELTEGAISNIIIKRNGVFLTPELSCGLLNGIYRQHFIDNNNVVEAKINRKMLLSSDEIFLCNSVRGIRKVELSI
ncbi:MAG: aminodeoxychorismate synthase, component I, partial [bacterium]|nr:aminodeoxychorismate synthase, component I [bacterium]